MSGYYCAECGLTVKVLDTGDLVRSCDHDGAAVLAPRTATLYGEGGAAERGLVARAVAALRLILASFKSG